MIGLIDPSSDAKPEGTPYVVVAEDGKVLVSSNTRSELFVHDGGEGLEVGEGWRTIESEQKKGYTRALTLIYGDGL